MRVIGSCNCITCVANRDSCIVGVVAVFFVWCLLFFSNSKFSVRSTTIKRFKNLPSLVTALIDVQFAYHNRRFKISRRNFLNNSLFSFHSRDMWNYLDMGIVFIYVVILVCRIATFHYRWRCLSQSLVRNRQLLLWVQHAVPYFTIFQYLRA